ncbi:hypothetical protein HD553DRAFT_268927, partial [Filobasidium floriforme]|uniref:uncharacterized protein n=1 Tax=Filobasidium floriforme TaxID=5210 RepID=UPI001E8CD1CE
GIQYTCDACSIDITHTVRIKCAAQGCEEVDLCPSCFSEGKELGGHKAWHDYRVVETHSRPIFSEDWGADEELLLISGLQTYGLGNWAEVADYVGTRLKEDCERHYTETYLAERSSTKKDLHQPDSEGQQNGHLPGEQNENDIIERPDLGGFEISQEEFQTRKKRRIEELRKPAPLPAAAIETKASAPQNHEVAGFMPGRLEFDHEVENEAEMVIKDMDFGLVFAYGGSEMREDVNSSNPTKDAMDVDETGDDEDKPLAQLANVVNHDAERDSKSKRKEDEEEEKTPLAHLEVEDSEDMELKLIVLEVYYSRLGKRQQVKDFIFDRGLMDYKRLMALEKKRGKEEAGLINRYKVFAKMQTAEDFEVLVDGLICKLTDEQTLRKKIAEIQDYRRNGITTVADAQRFDRLRNERASGVRPGQGPVPREPMTSSDAILQRRSYGGGESMSQDKVAKTPYPAPAHFLHADDLQLLSPEEQTLCCELRILPRPYLLIKDTIVRECARRGGDLERHDAGWVRCQCAHQSDLILTSHDAQIARRLFDVHGDITCSIYDHLQNSGLLIHA